MDRSIAINLDQPISPEWLGPHLGKGRGPMSGVECDSRAGAMTIREALVAAAQALAKAAPREMDMVALGAPAKLKASIESHAASMVIEALASSG